MKKKRTYIGTLRAPTWTTPPQINMARKNQNKIKSHNKIKIYDKAHDTEFQVHTQKRL